MPVSELTSDPLLANVPVHEGYKVLGGVVLYQKLGQGGMGAVYRGHHLRLKIDVALKLLAPPSGLSPEQTAEFVRRFLREAQTAATVKHQNLVRVYDVASDFDLYYLVMEHVDGESASERLKRKGKICEREALEICAGAAEGLAAAHRKGIVHRDVKPDNILINKEGEVVVADLGLAKAFAGEDPGAPSMLTQTQTAMGTPFYMAPEQFASARDVGPAADAWSLGVTLYQLLTGEVPWTDTSVFILAEKIRGTAPPDPKDLSPGLSDGACEIVDKALQKGPSERYGSCSEMAKAIRSHLDSIYASDEPVLADAAAGSTKLALISVSPPAANTMTLIAKAALGKEPRPAPPSQKVRAGVAEAGTAATIGAARARWPRWVVPAAVAGGAGLLLILLLALLLGGGASDGKPGKLDPLEAEAEVFYQDQLAAAEAGKDEEVERAIRGAGGKYDDTRFRLKIKELGDVVTERIAEKKARKKTEEDTAAKEAAFDTAVDAADEAEKVGELGEAVRQLKLALEQRDDPRIRERLAKLERRLEALGKKRSVERLLAEGAGHESAKEWDQARAKYEEALKDATGEDRRKALDAAARVKKQLEIEKTVGTVQRDIDAKRWREAWKAITEATATGLADPRLGILSRQVIKALAPPGRLTGPLGMELVLVPGGAFKMGSDAGKVTERPVHKVTVSSFYIGRCEVTQAEFEAFRKRLGALPGAIPKAKKLPAVSVSWQIAMNFCKHLSGIDKSGAAYRLPTEAEWEYAARGGEGRKYPWGNDPLSRKRANMVGREDGFPGLAPVGSFPQGVTPLGILDLAGNAAEWCADWYGPYSKDPQADPAGPVRGKARVVRGGAFEFDPSWARASHRAGRMPDHPAEFIGFRVVRELTAEEAFFHKKARQHE